jgi:hypothetical protein
MMLVCTIWIISTAMLTRNTPAKNAKSFLDKRGTRPP